MKINKILVPTDFSEPANKAVDQAVYFAALYDAEITILHARVMYADNPEKLPELEQREIERENELLAELKEDTSRHSDIRIKHEVIRGFSVHSALLSYINNNTFDLIVIGTHGRSGIKHFLLGSVAEKVVRYAPYPVITVPPDSRVADKYHKIVIPYDFSEHARLALENAPFFAAEPDSEIDVLYVVEDKYEPLLDGFDQQSIYESIPFIKEKAREKLSETLAELPDAGKISYNFAVKSGTPHKEIAEYAKEVNADLVIMATHGLVGIDRFILGSTTERVIRSVNAQILSLKLKKVI
jgi:nucleotide-binding universal stress UspA family protein